jgi:ABC-type multidrug transport system ATPase subunit
MIEISNLTVRFGQSRAIDDLNLKIRRGESILLAGANGSGKTTLLRAITGVLFPRKGTVSIDDIKAGARSRQKTAYIPASVGFYDGLKVKEAKKLHAAFYPTFSYREIGGFRLAGNRRVGSLSKGEKTLFLLSLALSTAPEYLLIDDVIHFLDPHLREIFLKSILHLIEEEQLTVIIASQSSFDIEGILERVVVLDHGRAVLDETVEELKRKFVKVYAEQLPDHLPVIFTKDWQGMKELYIYPYTPEMQLTDRIEYLTLSEIMRAFIGGEYDLH